MKVGIIYPKEKNQKVKTLRLLKKENIEFNKLTAIIDTAEDLIPKLIELGNQFIEVDGKKSAKTAERSYLKHKKGFEILNRTFLKAIAEKNQDVMDFLRKNISKEEAAFLSEASK